MASHEIMFFKKILKNVIVNFTVHEKCSHIIILYYIVMTEYKFDDVPDTVYPHFTV